MDKIKCPLCNKEFQTLNSHLNFKHKLKPRDFLKLYPNHPLVSEGIKDRVSKTCKSKDCGKWRKGIRLTEEHKQKISNKTSGENNPFYGKKHSEQTRKKMSENHADFAGDKNPFRNWIKDESNYDIWYDNLLRGIETVKNNPDKYKKLCESRSEIASKSYIDGKLKPYGHHHKWGHFKSEKFKNEFYYQSSYELRFLQFCENSPKIKTLIKNKFRIDYVVEGRTHKYIPDFIVNGTIVVEIKPVTMLNYLNNNLKIQAGKAFCEQNGLVYQLIMEKELENLSSIFV